MMDMVNSMPPQKGGTTMQTEILTNKQYKDFSRNLIKAVEGRCRIVPINSLKKSGYTLNQPIYISIETDKDTVIASLDDIEAFAYADTEFEAVNGLCEEIVTLYDDLRANRNNLGILPEKWLSYLDSVITIHEKC
jgi:type I restriction-modification system DNA methylase subunit